MEVPFASSPRSSLGLEWELQLVDKDSLELRQCAQVILDRLRPAGEEKHPQIHPEMLLNTVEVVSRPQMRVADAAADLARSIEEVQEITDPMRIELMGAGTHPFARPQYQKVTDKDRYAELVERTRYWGRQMLLYGLHMHVGIDDQRKVLPLLRALLTRFGVLQSLAAASPFWAAKDTGYATNRAMIFQQLPTAGVPYQFDTWPEYERYVHDMMHTGVIDEINEIRWDIRPSPNLGTIEVRMCDATSNMVELKAIAALTQCLVEHFSRRLDAGETLPTLPQWYVAENKWRSARYGMDAIIILDDAGNEALITDILPAMLAELEPVAADLGCLEELAAIDTILSLGASYQRQKRVAHAHHGDLDSVVRHLVSEFTAGEPLAAE